MSRLLDALKKRYKTPQAALQQLGLDAALVIPTATNNSVSKIDKNNWVGDEWSDAARKAATEARKRNAHLRVTATHEQGSGKGRYVTYAANHAEAEKHLAALREHAKKNGSHNVHIENTRTGEVHSAKVGPQGVHQRSYTSLDSAEHLTKTKSTKDSAMAGDSKESKMPKTRYSPTALVAMGALQTYLAPRLAMDATISLPILKTLDHKNFKAEIPNLIKAIKTGAKGKLAQDADVEDVAEVLEAIGSMDPSMLAEAEEEQDTPVEESDETTDPDDEEPHDEPDGDEGPAMMAKVRDWLKGKVPPEMMSEFDEMIGEEARGQDEVDVKADKDHDPSMMTSDEEDDMEMDEFPDFKGAPKVGKGAGMDKQAMDAAIDSRVAAAVAAERKNQTDIRNAFTFVRPWVGELAMDAGTPFDVYRAALKTRGVSVKELPDAALKPVLEAQPRAGAGRHRQQQIASDSATGGSKAPSFSEMFPNTTRIGHA